MFLRSVIVARKASRLCYSIISAGLNGDGKSDPEQQLIQPSNEHHPQKQDQKKVSDMTMYDWATMSRWSALRYYRLLPNSATASESNNTAAKTNSQLLLTNGQMPGGSRELQELMAACHANMTITAFNRLLRRTVTKAETSAGVTSEDSHAAQQHQISRFQALMSFLADMEGEPLNLTPNVETFEIALMAMARRGRMAPLIETLFGLMETPRYGLRPSPACWAARISASLTDHPESGGQHLYRQHFSTLPADPSAAATFFDVPAIILLLRTTMRRGAFSFIDNLLLPDLEKRPWLVLTGHQWVQLLCSVGGTSMRALPLIRWLVRTGRLDPHGPRDVFSESLCWRWLEWLANTAVGSGASDLAETALRRIIALRLADGRPVPLRFLEKYKRIVEREFSVEGRGQLHNSHLNLVLPLSDSARALYDRVSGIIAKSAALTDKTGAEVMIGNNI